MSVFLATVAAPAWALPLGNFHSFNYLFPIGYGPDKPDARNLAKHLSVQYRLSIYPNNGYRLIEQVCTPEGKPDPRSEPYQEDGVYDENKDDGEGIPVFKELQIYRDPNRPKRPVLKSIVSFFTHQQPSAYHFEEKRKFVRSCKAKLIPTVGTQERLEKLYKRFGMKRFIHDEDWSDVSFSLGCTQLWIWAFYEVQASDDVCKPYDASKTLVDEYLRVPKPLKPSPSNQGRK